MDQETNNNTSQPPEVRNSNQINSTSSKGPILSLVQKLRSRKVLPIVIGVFLLLAIGTLVVIVNFVRNNSEYSKSVAIADEAQDAYKKGNFAEAETKLKEIYDDFPDDPIVQAALIKSISNQGNLTGTELEAYEKAKPYIDKALDTNPSNVEVLLAAGYSEEIAGNYEKALEYYQKAQKIAPTNAQVMFSVGHVLEFLNRQDEAIQAYEGAFELNPQDPSISMAKAKVLLLQGQGEESLELYKNTANLADIPVTLKSEAYTNASILARSNMFRFNEAMDYAKKSVEADPNFAPAVGNYGFLQAVYYQQPQEGEANLKKAIELNPRISQHYWLLAAFYRMQNNYPDAIRYTQTALDMVDNDNTLLTTADKNKKRATYSYDLATAYSLAGQNENILEPLSLALSLEPSLKEVAQTDFQDQIFFQGLSNNQQFLTLIQ